METSQETQAPLTEKSNQLPPIPPVPLVPPIPVSPFATPPPSSCPQQLSMTVVGRPILKPAAPSKCPTSVRTPQNTSDNIEVENAFPSKELAEVIATCQRRERSWHECILIYTTVISNKESTVAVFEDEIEKKEAAPFKI
ncbi:hypothetical protein EPUL_005176 [Erysiphe pulchra]|uniref:Uncharacterized protein n=1 Tax=Erysiphe pulchra TaxID=225359 RepID=A0A2S4PS44_9PEZI|nr:hypothetical protein EPUL_005176 [Erysiphe pulchra]